MPSGKAKGPAAGTPSREILEPGSIFCPVGRALDVIGDRWSLVLVRHLLRGTCGFQDLRVRTGIAPRVLSHRLRTLRQRGFVETTASAARPQYQVTERGRSLEPIIAAIARWYLLHGLDDLKVDANRFSATSARSVLESLPFLLRDERAQGVDLTFEIRLTGLGGGVWTVAIKNGVCTVASGFADKADIRYTADAHVWCGVALGLTDASEMYRQGLLHKDGSREAMDFYFHQIARNPPRSSPRAERRDAAPNSTSPPDTAAARRPL